MQKATMVSSVPPTKTPRATPSATTSRIPAHPHLCTLDKYEFYIRAVMSLTSSQVSSKNYENSIEF